MVSRRWVIGALLAGVAGPALAEAPGDIAPPARAARYRCAACVAARVGRGAGCLRRNLSGPVGYLAVERRRAR